MVSPDGTRPEPERPTSGRTTLFVLAGLVIIVGFLALGSITTPDPEAIEETTTTSTTIDEVEPPIDVDNFTVGQIVTGDPLEWERVATTGDIYPHTLVEHDGLLYLFGSTTSVWAVEPGSLVAWRSGDGVDWESLGTVIGDETEIGVVSATPQGLVAIETHRGGAGLTVWRSGDGFEWSPTDIPVETDIQYVTIYPMAVGGTADTLIVSAGLVFDLNALLEERLTDIGIEVDLLSTRGWGTESSGDELGLIVYGPLGIPAFETTAADLGLTDEERQWVINGFGGTQETNVWVARDGDDWEPGTIDGLAWLESIVVTPDGWLLASGWGNSGAGSWHSDDGLVWDRADSLTSRPSKVTTRGNSLVGLNNNTDPTELMVSNDGADWEKTGLADHFPLPIGWSADVMGAGGGGIAVSMTGWGQNRLAPQLPASPTLTKDGVTLTLALENGVFEIESGGTVHTWNVYAEHRPEGIDVDLANETVTFNDPTTGDELATFTFAELEAAESRYWADRDQGEEFPAFAFTPDAESWTIQNIRAELGEEARITHLEVTTDRVVAVIGRSTDRYNSSAAPGFEIWSAAIP